MVVTAPGLGCARTCQARRAMPARAVSTGAWSHGRPGAGPELTFRTEVKLRLGFLTDSKYGIAREFVHKHDGGDGSAEDASILEEEWTAWTGATTPPVVTSTRSFSSPSGTPARPCSRSMRQSRSAPGAS